MTDVSDPTPLPVPAEEADRPQRYDVQAGSEPAAEHDQVLVDGESFALFDRHGDIRPVGLGEEGVYRRGTRHLSRLALLVAGRRPLLLGSTTRRDNSRLAVDLANTDYGFGEQQVAHSQIHLSRSKVLLNGVLHERLVVRSFARRPVQAVVALRFGADFADIFEVRGMRRPARGRELAPKVGEREVLLRYAGLDGVIRRTRITFSPEPDALDAEHASFTLDLPDARAVTIELTVACEVGAERPNDVVSWDGAAEQARAHLPAVIGAETRLTSSNEVFNDWLERSIADLAMLTVPTAQGLYPHAGIPWFSTQFGRDGLISAMQALWLAPDIARGVLDYLATWQADRVDATREAEPGKILHEVREGEMATLGEIPFGRYYGSHDATPLFVMLAAAYYRQTDDRETAARLWPHIERALGWMEEYGDVDGDGFLEYAQHAESGLIQQGWKDSADSVFHADGRLADPPIALCEVQAYAYGAYQGAAELAEALGHERRAHRLRRKADELRLRFDEAFWDEELGTYALALDGAKRRCRVRSSNAGHALLTGIALPERAERVARALTDEAAYSGWGVRTVSADAARYNPMSYHNGSVWPHDNALIALGLARYGFGDLAARILSDLFDASRQFDLSRLPELFCGFSRRDGEGPTRYPVACSPQAWSAGSVFMLLEAALGLEVDGPRRQVRFRHAVLPEFLDSLTVEGLHVGPGTVDLVLDREAHGAGVRILQRRGELEVVALK